MRDLGPMIGREIRNFLGLRKRINPDQLRIMHLWNTAGIGGLIARYMDRMKGSDSCAYMWERWDPFFHGTEKTIRYHTIFGKLKTPFLLRTARHYDVIHNHGLDGLTPWLRLLYPRKKIILHYHGTRVREKWDEKKKFWRYADHILVSTPDLLDGAPEGALYVPNLLDWDTIDELKRTRRSDWDDALTVSRWCDDKAQEIADAHDLVLNYHDRESQPMNHVDFLKYLSGFSAYIDIKREFPGHGRGQILRAHSLTGLEAMGLGLDVYDWDGRLSDHDIENHRPENVIPLLWELYND